MLLRMAGLIVREAVAEFDPIFPVIVAIVVVETAAELTAKVAVVAPAATVTVAGVVADGEFEESVTGVPPVPAALGSVIVPVVVVPP